MDLFRSNPERGPSCAGWRRGEIDEDEFSRRLGGLLGVSDHEGLVDRLFARHASPTCAMVEAVKPARKAAGIRTGLVSNSLGEGRYDRSTFPELFDGVVISGEVGMHKPEPEIFELGAERAGCPPRSACSWTTCARTARGRRRWA